MITATPHIYNSKKGEIMSNRNMSPFATNTDQASTTQNHIRAISYSPIPAAGGT